MAPTAIQRLLAERDSIQDTLSLIDGRVTDKVITPLSETTVKKLLKDLATAEVDLKNVHTSIRTIADPTDIDVHKKTYWDMASLINTLHNALHGILASFPAATSTPVVPSTSSPIATMRLPKLELKTFDGNLLEWISFRDVFKTSVHDSPTLSKVQKMTYLQSLLKGEAARQTHSMILSDANYDIAWQQLHDRYQNDREILFATLRRFFSLPVASTTPGGIRTLIDTTRECLRSLEILNIKSEKCSDAIILYSIINKLDPTTRELWEQQLKGTSVPPLTDLFEFLEQRARSLAAGLPTKVRASVPREVKVHHGQSKQNSAGKCKVCSQSYHPAYKCQVFNSMDIPARNETIQKNNMCANCLNDNHTINRCTHTGRCRTCNGKHHTMLHLQTSSTDSAAVTPRNSALNLHTYIQRKNSQSFLSTAIINVTGVNGQLYPCRAFIDNGSDTNYITESCSSRLALPRTRTYAEITGLNSTSVGSSDYETSFMFSSYFSSHFEMAVEALVVPQITGRLPMHKCDISSWSYIKGLTLADPQFNIPSGIDILLGVDVFWEILQDGKRRGPIGNPVASNSRLGWLMGGKRSSHTTPRMTHFTEVTLDRQLESFFELEFISMPTLLTKEERDCEQHFAENTIRDSSGRFTVSIPLKLNAPRIGHSRDIALQRLYQLERRLAKNQSYMEQYHDFMNEYLALGHMSLAPAMPTSGQTPVFIPHHFVLKEDSTTTKFRVVFDASAKTSSGSSLNDTMMVGPKLQDSLWDIVLRFRIHRYAFTADIAKMYRQINIRPEDQHLQNILWRTSSAEDPQEYQLNTVTYGTASAPYLAVKVLQTLATELASELPLASKVALNDFYVDDVMSGADDLETALLTQKQLLQLTESGKFPLRKWCSNSPELLASLPNELREQKAHPEISLDPAVKTLGLRWNTQQDTFEFRSYHQQPVITNKVTKRIVLSEMSKLFDPVGWLAPVIVRAKILIQTLWKLQADWDEEVPPDVKRSWLEIKEDLKMVNQISIPRCIIPHSPTRLSLAGFSDASVKAYSAVVYLVADFEDKESCVSLLAAKTRVAPAKTITVPRLELCGSVLLSNLIPAVAKALNTRIDSFHAWTDSTIVLDWLDSQPSDWKTFVANRITEVQNNLPSTRWHHIPGEENPADCATRGLSIAELLQFELWWKGPPWLANLSSMAFENNPDSDDQDLISTERKKVVVVHTAIKHDLSLLEKYSSLTQLIRITAWLLRSCANPKTKSNRLILTPQELDAALKTWIKLIQNCEFHDEISRLSSKKELSSKSKIRPLNPFLDEEGILRVGGRLRNSSVSTDRKTPMLLPRHSKFTELLIVTTHRQFLHAGPTLLLSILSRRFWIVRGRDAVRFLVRKCVVCTRQTATIQQQFMADLPTSRVTPCRAFKRCGVDYAGPFLTKPNVVRSKITTKSYLALFVCFSTRAFHLEVVSSLSSEAFLAAFRRFVSRRGIPSDVHSDCGTNFVGANRELKEMYALVNSKSFNNKLADETSSQGINWHFNPPGAPHFGGLWEAGVKSVKYHLNRVVGSTRLTFEELTTTMTQIEACLNSRPITPASSDPSDLSALTSGHFLIGEPLVSIPEPDLMSLNQNRLSRWQLIQSQQQQFWKRWSNEFLSRLQQRPKWLQQRNNLKIGDMVIIKEENLPPQKWRLGRVLQLHPGKDNNVRVTTLRTAEGEIKRPVHKLCLLPIHEDVASEVI